MYGAPCQLTETDYGRITEFALSTTVVLLTLDEIFQYEIDKDPRGKAIIRDGRVLEAEASKEGVEGLIVRLGNYLDGFRSSYADGSTRVNFLDNGFYLVRQYIGFLKSKSQADPHKLQDLRRAAFKKALEIGGDRVRALIPREDLPLYEQALRQ